MYHIKDEEFIRGDCPMSKEEIRVVSISKLDLKKDSILLDIGAGTGSIGIEASRYLKKGKVIGVECNKNAIDLIKKNLDKFCICNYELINTLAPKNLPKIKFDRMFIGGSRGNMEEILKYFIKYSKANSKIVINAIAIESLSQSLEFLKKYFFEDIEITLLNVSKNKSIGKLNMMMAHNPIYIISAKKGVNNG